MVFNIEDGGTLVSLDQVIEAVRLAKADVVALQEAMGNTARIATALGWTYASARTQVLSRLPVFDRDDGSVDVELAPGHGIWVVSVHLPADPYGPSLAARSDDAAAVEALERRVRLPVIEEVLARHPDGDGRMPTFLLGDFNAPSHLDAASQAHGRPVIEWPVSRAIEAAGFR